VHQEWEDLVVAVGEVCAVESWPLELQQQGGAGGPCASWHVAAAGSGRTIARRRDRIAIKRIP